ncbi:UPF0415 protein C7orf25 homolog isoform X2 [Dendrobium catenatum]|uniref:UPF0415 protein C7orf25 homolog isoform X2 n=1 Tax=Dendrobium catenatum TaxID=906689 RepID=UPI0010A0589A|nr:UPF0415 protein C7orf25 homolog isoform X2 [Dendrobium catenatum]
MGPAVVQHASEAEQLQSRCLSLQAQIATSFPPFKLSNPAKLTLLRLVRAELRFLHRLPFPSTPITSNIGYFESIVRVLLHPAVRNASRLCKPVPSNSAHVDIVCTFGSSPAWFLVSHRNPIRISWSGSLRSRAERTLLAARSASVTLKPTYLFLVFSRGLPDDAASAIAGHLGAVEIDAHAECIVFEDLEDGWVGVESWGMEGSRWFRIQIEGDDLERFNEVSGFASVGEGDEVDRGKDAFGELMSCLRPGGVASVDLINFDTTALIAMVSGISNGAAERLLGAPEVDLRRRFKGNYKFVIEQATSELDQPILLALKVVLEGKKGIICERVRSEFKELMFMCGGANEKFRADQLLKHLLVVPDSPSARISALPTTRKIAEKNKVIFGTGDHYRAPTLTANMGFVRAISQTGMSLLTIEHRPRALTELIRAGSGG